MPEFLLNQLIPEEEQPKEGPKEKSKKEFEYNEGKTKEEFIERLIDLLDDSRSDDRTEWTEISFIINNELGSEGLPLFQSFSNRSDKYLPNKDDKWYLNLSPNEKGLYIGTLMKKAKEDNPDEYKELRQEYVKQKETTIDDPIKATFTILEKDIAESTSSEEEDMSFHSNGMPTSGEINRVLVNENKKLHVRCDMLEEELCKLREYNEKEKKNSLCIFDEKKTI